MTISDLDAPDMPNVVAGALTPLDVPALAGSDAPSHPPRILLLYGSLRDTSYSRAAAQEGARVLRALGCETKLFDPSGLPLPDDAPDTHPKVQELRDLVMWSEGMVWSSPERHGAMTGIMKSQIDWIPLSPIGGVRPTQGKTLVPKAWAEFEGGRMKPSPLYNRIVDVMEELARFTVMTRGRKDMLVDRYSERVESLEDVHKRVNS